MVWRFGVAFWLTVPEPAGSVRTAPGQYPILTRRVTLPAAVDDGKAIARAALALWDAVSRGLTVRLLGVAVSNMTASESQQLALFTASDTGRQAALNRATDALIRRFGARAIVRASSLE